MGKGHVFTGVSIENKGRGAKLNPFAAINALIYRNRGWSPCMVDGILHGRGARVTVMPPGGDHIILSGNEVWCPGGRVITVVAGIVVCTVISLVAARAQSPLAPTCRAQREIDIIVVNDDSGASRGLGEVGILVVNDHGLFNGIVDATQIKGGCLMHGVRPWISRVSGGKGRPGLVVNTRVIVELVIARPLRLP